MGQYDKAMQEYDEAEKLDPKLAAIYLNRAIILHRAKDAPERAVELYKKYIGMAGDEVALSAEAPVFKLLSEAEAVINAKAEAKAAEDQAKKMEELQAQQQAELKKAEDQQKAAPPGQPPRALRRRPRPRPTRAARSRRIQSRRIRTSQLTSFRQG